MAAPVILAFARGAGTPATTEQLRVLGSALALGAGLFALVVWKISGRALPGWVAVALADFGLFGLARYGLPSFGPDGNLDLVDPVGRVVSSVAVGVLLWIALRAPEIEAGLLPAHLIGATTAAGLLVLGILAFSLRAGGLDPAVAGWLPQVVMDATSAAVWLAAALVCAWTSRRRSPARPADWLVPVLALLAVEDALRSALPGWPPAAELSAGVRLVAVGLAASAVALQLRRLLTHQDAYALRLRQDLDGLRGQVDAEERVLQERFHDLRNAVAAMRSADLVLRRHAGGLDEGTRATLADALTAELSRLQSLILEPVRLPRPSGVALAAALAPVIAAERSYGMDLRVDLGDLTAWADGELLAQVVQNVLVNARRHAPGSPVRIHASRSGASIELRVADRGPGIPGEERERIFERGARGARATGTAGSGLGLYVARNLMAGMGGHIQVDPGRDGPGSCFVLTLPAVPEARGTVPPAGLWRAVRLAS